MWSKSGAYVQCVHMRENAKEMIKQVNVVVFVIELCTELEMKRQQLLLLRRLLPLLPKFVLLQQ